MSNIKPWKSGAVLLMAFSMTAGAVAPLMAIAPASAQTYSQPYTVTIPSGTSIPLRFDQAEKIIITPNETKDLTLTVARNVTSSDGRTILIPSGSQVVGQLRPTQRGSQFVARQLITNPGQSNSRQVSISGRSRVVTRTEQIQQGSSRTTTTLSGAALGGGAAAAIAALTGDRAIATEELLSGVGLGALGGFFFNRDRKVDVVVVYPNQDLAITLNSSVALR